MFKYLKKMIYGSINYLIELLASRKYNLIHVVEYPKCGATWVSRLIETYLNTERSIHDAKIITNMFIRQKHVLYKPYYNKVVVVLRDPRDVYVSFYFHEVYLKKDKKLLTNMGYNGSLSDQANFKKYLLYKLNNPQSLSPGFSFSEFYRSWIDKPNIHIVHYEQLHNNPEEALVGIVKYLGYEINDSQINKSIKRHEFKNITGREKGQEDKNSHKRKGIVGDWKNYFTDELSDIMDQMENDIVDKITLNQIPVE
jgi:hypothetical protein